MADNRWSNLRCATQQENLRNRRGGGASGVKNVYRDFGKWAVRFKVSGRIISFGRYADLDTAKGVAHRTREALHGEFVNHW